MPSISYAGSQSISDYYSITMMNVDTMPTDGWITNISADLRAANSGDSFTMRFGIYVGTTRQYLGGAQTGGYNGGAFLTRTAPVQIQASSGNTIRWGYGLSSVPATIGFQDGGSHNVNYNNSATPPSTWSSAGTWSSTAIRGELTYVANVAPSTPTQVAPASGATGVSLTPSFQGTNQHGSDAAYDSTDQVQLQIQRVSDSVIVSDTTFTPSTTADGGTWTKASPVTLTGGVSYQWRIRHSDSFGLWSSWSGYRTFTTLQGPSAPTAVAPTGKINAINTFNYQYTYSHPTPLSANAIQIQVYNLAGTTLLYDSGTVTVSTANGGTATVAEWHADLGWGTNYKHQARFRDTGNTWGPYSDMMTFWTDAPPNAPTNLQPTGSVSTGTSTLTCNVSDPNGDVVTAAQAELVNVATGAVVSGYPKAMTVDSIAGTASLNASADLVLGTQYKWRARADDGLGPGYGSYSAYSFFTFVAAPTVTLLTPPTTRQNVISQPGAEYDPATLTTFWTESNRSGTNFVDRVVDANAAWGNASWEATAAATGDNRFTSALITIDATKPWLFQTMLKKISGTSTTHFAVECYTSANALISTVYPTSILTANATNVASSWTRYGGIVWPIGSGNSPAFPATTAKVKVVWTPSRTTAAVVRADAFFVGSLPLPASSTDWTTLQPWYGYGDPNLGGYGTGGYTWTAAEGDSNSQNLAVVTAPPGNVLISYTGGTGSKNSDRLYIQRWTGTTWASLYDSGWSTTTTRTLIPVPTNVFTSETRYRVRVEARDTSLVVGTSAWSEIDVRFEGPPEPVIGFASSDTVNARINIQYSLTNNPTALEFGGVELQRIPLDGTEETQIVEVNTSVSGQEVIDHFPLSGVNYLYRIRQIKQDGANRIQSRWASMEMSVDYSPFTIIKDAEDPFNLTQFETRVENVSAPEEDAPLSSMLAWGQTMFSHDVGLARLRSGEISAEFYSDAGVYGVPDYMARYNVLRKMVTGVLSPGQKPSRRTICILLRNPDPERIFAIPVGPVQRLFEAPVGTTKRVVFNYQETSWIEDWYIRNGWT